MREGGTAAITRLSVEVDAKRLAYSEIGPAVGEGAKPQFWALQVSKNAYRAPRRAFD